MRRLFSRKCRPLARSACALALFAAITASDTALAQLTERHRVFLSSFSLSPAGLYGSDGESADGLAYLYPRYAFRDTFTSSPPVASPSRVSFARFESGPRSHKLVIRSLLDGATSREIPLTGYNPQWFPDGRRIFCEGAREGSQTRFLRVDAETGDVEEIGAATDQYYPPGEPGGAAALSPDGAKVAYHRLVPGPSGRFTPYVYDLRTQTERQLLASDKPCEAVGIVPGQMVAVERAVLTSLPPAPLTLRHVSWSPDADRLAMVGSLLVDNVATFQGLFVVAFERTRPRVVFIQKSANLALDHLENFFISPDGDRILYNLSVLDEGTNRPHLFVSPAYVPLPRDLGRGSIPARQPSKEYWPLSPWSHDALAILYQDPADGTLWKRGTGEKSGPAVRLTPPPAAGAFRLLDAQWVDFDAVMPPDVEIEDIKAVQAIEDVPLIQHKATMVRVFVKLKRATRLDKVTVEMKFGASMPAHESVTLINHRGATYAVPPSEVDRFLRVANGGDQDLFARIYTARGYRSVNFLGPYRPRDEGALTITASVDPFGTLGETEDLDRDDNRLSSEHTVKPVLGQVPGGPPKKYMVRFQPARFLLPTPHGRSDHKNDEAALRAKAKLWAAYLQATFPLPEVKFRFDPETITRFNVLGVSAIEPLFATLSFEGLFGKAVLGFDRTVHIMPEGSLIGLITGAVGIETQGVSWPSAGVKYTIALDESAPEHTLAHEIGHTYGLDHDDDERIPFGYLAMDGWDVLAGPQGARISPYPTSTDNVSNHYSFMQSGAPGIHPWPTRAQYLALMDELVKRAGRRGRRSASRSPVKPRIPSSSAGTLTPTARPTSRTPSASWPVSSSRPRRPSPAPTPPTPTMTARSTSPMPSRSWTSSSWAAPESARRGRMSAAPTKPRTGSRPAGTPKLSAAAKDDPSRPGGALLAWIFRLP